MKLCINTPKPSRYNTVSFEMKMAEIKIKDYVTEGTVLLN